MKKLDLILCALFFSLIIAATPSDAYEKAMQSAIETLFSAESLEDYQAVSNSFDRIAQKEAKEWHPKYYKAYAHIIMSTKLQNATEKDDQLDAAMELLIAADALSPNNSELLALEGFVHMIRVTIDPGSRGPEYAGQSMGALQKAIGMNPKNPRAHMLLSDMQIGMARFMGGDNSEGCATLKKALALYENEKTESTLDPNWGKEWALSKKGQCE